MHIKAASLSEANKLVCLLSWNTDINGPGE